MNTALLYIATLVCYAIIDLAWINLFAKSFIRKQVGSLMAHKPDLMAGGVFYIIFTIGLLYFCVYPALLENSIGKALISGALFGLMTYGTYELVNKALLNNWPWPLVIIDIIWGVFAGALVSFISFKIGGHFI